MNVGIITYHAAHNYGSALQAYALYKSVEAYGHHVEIINYRTDRQDNLYKIYNKQNSVMGFLRNVQSFFYRKSLNEHHMRFDKFILEHTDLSGDEIRDPSKLKKLNNKYDCFVCGSDQIWNPNCVDFDTSYLLDFVTDKKRCISYAPSLASDSFKDTWRSVFNRELSGFSALSVREHSGAKTISEITGRSVKTVLDPVFLIDNNLWNSFVSSKNMKYILCYFIGDIPGMRMYAQNLSQKYNLPIVVINKNLRDLKMNCIKMYESGPSEFVNLIANANTICTNSFHAVAFSLIFNKEFHVFVDNNNANTARCRILEILDSVNLSDRVVNDVNILLPVMEKKDFEYHDVLNCLISQSKNYLENSLKTVEKYTVGNADAM